ncbi:MAG: DUF3298 domain-containing protein [Lachnospiraceae bacterium]
MKRSLYLLLGMSLAVSISLTGCIKTVHPAETAAQTGQTEVQSTPAATQTGESQTAAVPDGTEPAQTSQAAEEEKGVNYLIRNQKQVLNNKKGDEMGHVIYDTIELTEQSKENYKALDKSLTAYTEKRQSYISKKTKEFEKNIKEDDKGDSDFNPMYFYDSVITVARADESVFSFKEEIEEYNGGVRPSNMIGTANIKVSDGTTIRLSDIVNIDNNFKLYLAKQLQNDYTVEDFFDFDMVAETIRDLFDDEDYEPAFTINDEGITIYFDEMLLGPAASGIMESRIRHEDAPELFTDEITFAESQIPMLVFTPYIKPIYVDEKEVASVSYQTVSLTPASEKKYPDLQAALDYLSDGRRLYVSAVMSDYESSIRDAIKREEALAGPYSFSASFKVERCDNEIVSLRDDIYQYVGGPHPSTSVSTWNYHSDTGEQVMISEILILGDDLYAYIEEVLKEDYGDDIFYNDDVSADIKALFENEEMIAFTLTEDTVTIIFPEYALAPYSEGILEAEIRTSEAPAFFNGSFIPEN